MSYRSPDASNDAPKGEASEISQVSRCGLQHPLLGTHVLELERCTSDAPKEKSHSFPASDAGPWLPVPSCLCRPASWKSKEAAPGRRLKAVGELHSQLYWQTDLFLRFLARSEALFTGAEHVLEERAGRMEGRRSFRSPRAAAGLSLRAQARVPSQPRHRGTPPRTDRACRRAAGCPPTMHRAEPSEPWLSRRSPAPLTGRDPRQVGTSSCAALATGRFVLSEV